MTHACAVQQNDQNNFRVTGPHSPAPVRREKGIRTKPNQKTPPKHKIYTQKHKTIKHRHPNKQMNEKKLEKKSPKPENISTVY